MIIGDELWAWQVEEQPDVWSLVGVKTSAGHIPLIHRNRELVENKMAPLARQHAEATDQRLRLAHFIRVT